MRKVNAVPRCQVHIRDGDIQAFDLTEGVSKLQLGHVFPRGNWPHPDWAPTPSELRVAPQLGQLSCAALISAPHQSHFWAADRTAVGTSGEGAGAGAIRDSQYSHSRRKVRVSEFWRRTLCRTMRFPIQSGDGCT